MKLFSSPQAGAHVIAIIVVAGFVTLVSVLAIHKIEETTMMTAMASALAAQFNTVVSYYLGSSMSSAQKTAQISHLIGQSPAPTASEAPVAPAGA